MQTLTDVLIVLFLALGCVWFAVDIVRKLRQPAPGNAEPRLGRLASAPAVAAPAPAPLSPILAAPAPTHSPAAPAPAPVAAREPAEPAPAADGVPAPHLAVVAAVIHHLYKGRARLAGVLPVPVSSATHAPIDWAREGRRDIFTSHRVR